MRIVALIARLLLGLIFFVLGLNGFLQFLNMGPMPSGLAGNFMGALFQSHYLWVVAALQIIGGALLLVGRFVPLALALLGPVIFNILMYPLLMNPPGIALGRVVTVLWRIVFSAYRGYFSGMFVANATQVC